MQNIQFFFSLLYARNVKTSREDLNKKVSYQNVSFQVVEGAVEFNR